MCASLSKLKVITKKSFVFILTSIVFSLLFTMAANAYTTHNESGDKVLTWVIGHSDNSTGIVVLTPVSARCVNNYFENYNIKSKNLVLTKHQIFTAAKEWSGKNPEINAALDVSTGRIKYYNKSGNYMLTITPTTPFKNVITGSGWIWNDRYSTKTLSTGKPYVTGIAEGNFYCPNAMSNWYQKINTTIHMWS